MSDPIDWDDTVAPSPETTTVHRAMSGKTGMAIPPEVIGQGADEPPHWVNGSSAQSNGAYLPNSAPDLDTSTGGEGPALSDRPAEAHVLSCLLLDPSHQLAPEVFYYPEHRLLYQSIRNLHTAGKPVELATIAADLSDRGLFDQCGGWPFLFQIEARDKIPTTLHLQHYTERITTLHARRQARQHAEATLEALSTGAPLPKLPVVTAPSVTTTALAARLDAARVRLTTPPPEPQTRLFLAGKPIATPGNLVTVIAKSKTGKTASLGAAVAAILAAHYDRTDLDTFKFTAPHTDEAVILLDTEQSPYDAWTCHKRTMERAGGVQEPEWLHHYALVGDSAKTLRDVLPIALERGKTLHKGVFAIIIDGVADFVASVNDEVECNDFVAYLRRLSVDYNTPVICVIHSNEGVTAGDDGRGHLGKQLIRKAESNLVLKKDGEITTITSEKQRKAPITEEDGVAFKWDDNICRHVLCETVESKKRGAKKRHHLDNYLSVFESASEKSMTFPVLHRRANTKAPIHRDTFWGLLEEGVGTGEIQVNRANPNEPKYWIDRPSTGRHS